MATTVSDGASRTLPLKVTRPRELNLRTRPLIWSRGVGRPEAAFPVDGAVSPAGTGSAVACGLPAEGASGASSTE
jgi:hypothetical protein